MSEERLLNDVVVRNQRTRIWRAKKGLGSFLVLDLGERRQVLRRAGDTMERGSLQIWVQYCHWALRDERGSVLLDSGAPDSAYADALERLDGARLESLGLSPSGEVLLCCSCGLSLAMAADLAEYEREDDFLTIYEEGREPLSYSPARGVYSGE